nr:hypothetical protein [Umezakia ovalisporum]
MTNCSIDWVDATAIICVSDAGLRLDACAEFAISIDARNTGQASKIILAMFIIQG